MHEASSLPDTTGILQQLQKCPSLGLFHLLSAALHDAAQKQFGSAMATVVLRAPQQLFCFLAGANTFWPP